MEMQNRINFKDGYLAIFAIGLLTVGISVQAKTLSLENAELLAVQNDPSVRTIEASRAALSERAVEAGQLPDPMVKIGLGNLPTDSFNLGQEPMTQVQLGVVQKFPRGRTRSLRSDQFSQRSDGLDFVALDQRLRIIRAVREEFLEVLKQEKLSVINEEAVSAFTDLADITQDYYATGRVQQQDVLRASVELAKVQDRAISISQQEDRARARLAAWIGDAAYWELGPEWPAVNTATSLASLTESLKNHPRIRALQQNVVAAETGIELAREKYRPEFGLDLTYGGRGGRNLDGSGRSDLLSMMVVMDLPLFTAKRQDRLVAASVAESSAAEFHRDDVYRQMRSEIELQLATLQRENERIDLFQNTLLPDADFNSEATFEAYQAAVEDLTTLMRARITEFELQLEFARLQAESRKTLARLNYLDGAQQ
jgi:outer membrane protein TolC